MSEESLGIAVLFAIYTIAMIVFMFAAFPTYSKITNWFGGTLIAQGKATGWDMKTVVLPLIARNIPLIIVLGLLAEVDFVTTFVCYIISYLVLQSLASMNAAKKKG